MRLEEEQEVSSTTDQLHGFYPEQSTRSKGYVFQASKYFDQRSVQDTYFRVTVFTMNYHNTTTYLPWESIYSTSRDSNFSYIEEDGGCDDDVYGDDWIFDGEDDENDSDTRFLSESPSDQGSAQGALVTKKKRIRKKRPRKVPFVPRVVKHDIRRYYTSMIANVSNSHDISLLKSFYETYAAKNLTLRHTKFDVDFEQQRMKSIDDGSDPQFSLVGIDELVKFEFIRQQISPDQVISFTETSIKTRSDSDKSELVCRASVRFTRMYDINGPAIFDDILHKLVRVQKDPALLIEDAPGTTSEEESMAPSDQSLTSTPSEPKEDLGPVKAEEKQIMSVLTKRQPVGNIESELPDFFDYYHSSRGSAVPIIAQPKSFTLSAVIVIGINERRQLESFHFEKPSFVVDDA